MICTAIAASGTPRNAPAGIAVFAEFTSGGLARGRTTLLRRGPRYRVQGGKRNRGTWSIKSRDTAHSNQVRELTLGDSVGTLAEPQRRDLCNVFHP